MKLSAKWLVAVVAVGSIGLAYGQANVTGAWKGKLLFDMSKMPKAADPNQQKMMATMLEGVKKMSFSLKLNANKTFTMKVSGIPQGPGKPPMKDQTAEGTWSQKGTTLTLKATKQNGAAPKGDNKPQDLKIVEGGKKLELAGMGMGGSKVIFVR